MDNRKLFAIIRHCNFKSDKYKDSLIDTFYAYQVNQAETSFYDRFRTFVEEIENDEMLKYLNRDWFFKKNWIIHKDLNGSGQIIKFGDFWHWKLYEVSALDGWAGSDDGSVLVEDSKVYFKPAYVFPVCPIETFNSLDTANRKINLIMKNSGEVAVIVDGCLWTIESSAEKALSKVGAEIDFNRIEIKQEKTTLKSISQ